MELRAEATDQELHSFRQLTLLSRYIAWRSPENRCLWGVLCMHTREDVFEVKHEPVQHLHFDLEDIKRTHSSIGSHTIR